MSRFSGPQEFLTRQEAWVGEIWEAQHFLKPKPQFGFEREGLEIIAEIHRPNSQEAMEICGTGHPSLVVRKESSGEIIVVFTQPQIERALAMMRAADSKRTG